MYDFVERLLQKDSTSEAIFVEKVFVEMYSDFQEPEVNFGKITDEFGTIGILPQLKVS